MRYYADLHVHSRFSRATSRECDLEHLSVWAQKKGIAVVGTGDFTHPVWRAELREKLIPAEPGLFRLKPEIEQAVAAGLAFPHTVPTRFMLQVEISTIYKQGDKTRKVHHLIYAPDFACMDNIADRLAAIGNVTSDGRPILGLNSRDLLEIALEGGEGSFLIPAHVWTPWFSVLGSRSGFDAIEECYGDLTPEIFALETGLSSDPQMNWRVSALDRYALVSNSDAHSPAKLGREACVFDTELSYFAMVEALKTRVGYGGTIEFFPEEGKYHLDGHRKCGVRLEPEQTKALDGKCPNCGRPLTVGVMHRVCELADRPSGARPAHASSFRSLVPLCEILGELHGVGAGSKRVIRDYDVLLQRLGPELALLEHVPLDTVERQTSDLLAEALRRLRKGAVHCAAGYDGAYGRISVFEPSELSRRSAICPVNADIGALVENKEASAPDQLQDSEQPQIPGVCCARSDDRHCDDRHCEGPLPKSLHAADSVAVDTTPVEQDLPRGREEGQAAGVDDDSTVTGALAGLDVYQRKAASVVEGPLLIIAGPGTGKTRTLTHRIAHLIEAHGVPAEAILAITFTRRAAAEMQQRLAQLLPSQVENLTVTTFHGLGWQILRDHAEALGLPSDFGLADAQTQQTLLRDALGISARKTERLLEEISRAKRNRISLENDEKLAEAYGVYQALLGKRHLIDFDDLICLPIRLLSYDAALAATYRDRFRWICVDEYQDIDAQQYELVKLLAPPPAIATQGQTRNICAIGDPDQAIYGFRGADVGFFLRFCRDYPGSTVVQLEQSYRSEKPILEASLQVVSRSRLVAPRNLRAMNDSDIRVVRHTASTERAEAEYVVHSVEQLIGGHSFFSIDSGRTGGAEQDCFSFADFAVLYRTEAQADVLAEAFARSGIPCQRCSHRRVVETSLLRWLCSSMTVLKPGESLADRLGIILETDAYCDAEPEGPDLGVLATVGPWLRQVALRCDNDLGRFLGEVALGAEVDGWDPRADRVSLLTLHAAKGLEFAVVFIVGCEDGLLPLHWGSDVEQTMDEERRLLFVGMTRAKHRLYISHARKRLLRGRLVEREPSPFLYDIEDRLQELRESPAPRQKLRIKTQLSLF